MTHERPDALRQCAGLLIMAALLAGCGAPVDAATQAAYRRHRVPTEACRAPGLARVTPEAMRQDWDALERVLRRGYAGFVLTPEAEWDRVFREGRAAIPEEAVSALAWRDFLAERLSFADDNHLAFWIRDADGERRWRATSAHRLAHVSEATFTRRGEVFVDEHERRLVSCAGELAAEVVRPVWRDGGIEWRAVVASASPLDDVECVLSEDGTESTETLDVHPLAVADDPGPAFERRPGPIAWLRVRSLGMGARGRLERFVDSAAEVRDAPVVVLDLRGNGGGSDRFLLRWFRELTSQDLRYFDTRILTSEVELQGARTFWGCALAASRGDGEGREWIEERVVQAERLLEEAMRERGVFRDVREGRYVEPGRAPLPYAGRLILLVDRGCGSACETAVMLARQIDGALIVGENTEGTMKVGELRTYRLPGSGTWVSAGRRVHIDPALGGFPEGVGYAPDVWLDGGDVDASIRGLVACLDDATCRETVLNP